jgi:hypothetical protein
MSITTTPTFARRLRVFVRSKLLLHNLRGTLMNTSSRLSQAANVLRERGWHQGGMNIDEEVCILQALSIVDSAPHWSMVTVPDELILIVGPRLKANLSKRFARLPLAPEVDRAVALIYAFNDGDCADQAEAIEVLEFAADLARVREFVSAAHGFVSVMPDAPAREFEDEDTEGDWEHGPLELVR